MYGYSLGGTVSFRFTKQGHVTLQPAQLDADKADRLVGLHFTTKWSAPLPRHALAQSLHGA